MFEGERRRFMIEGTWVIAGQLLSAAGTLVGLRMMTGLLSPHVFGEVVLVSGIVLMAEGLTVAPLMQAVVRYYPEAAAANSVGVLRDATTNQLSRLTVLTGAICLIGFLLYSWFAPISAWLGPLALALLIVEVQRQYEITLLNSARCQRIAAIWMATEVWGRPIVAGALIATTGPTAVATLAGYLAASFAGLLLFKPWRITGSARQDCGHEVIVRANPRDSESPPVRRQIVPEEQQLVRSLRRYSMPLMPLGIIDWITSQADRFLIGALIGVEQAGLYAAVYGLASRPFLMAGGALELWMRPVYYEAILSGSSSREKHILHVWLGAILCAALIGTMAFTIWHEEIAALLLAAPYRTVSWLMPWIAAGYGLLLIAHLYGRVCYAHHDTKAVFVMETMGSVVSLIAAVYGLMVFGVAGAAYAVPVYFGTQLIAAKILARRAEDKRGATLWVGEHASV